MANRIFYSVITLGFIVSNIIAYALGVRMDAHALGQFWQVIDIELLRTDLLGSLYYFHAQPPLFNLFIGLGLKLFPESWLSFFAVMYSLMGLGLLVLTGWMMRQLKLNDYVSLIFLTLFAFHPNFMVYTHWLFYTLPMAFMVSLAMVLLVQYLRTGNSRWAHAFFFSAMICVLSRSVYHPLWYIGVGGGALIFMKAGLRKRFFTAAIIPFLLINLVFLKNYSLVGLYQGSSWVGLNFSQGWGSWFGAPLSDEEKLNLVKDKIVEPVWIEGVFQGPATYKKYGYFTDETLASREKTHPVMDNLYKTGPDSDQINFNHWEYAELSKVFLKSVKGAMLAYPDRYLERVRRATGNFLNPGPDSVLGMVNYDIVPMESYKKTVNETIIFGGGYLKYIVKYAGFPLLILFAIIFVLWDRIKKQAPLFDESLRAPIVYMILTVLWCTVCSCLVEVGENNRMRFMIDSFLLVFMAVGVDLARRWITVKIKGVEQGAPAKSIRV